MITLATAGRAAMLRRAVQRQSPNQHLNISRRAQSTKTAHGDGTSAHSTNATQTVHSNPMPTHSTNAASAGAGTPATATKTAQTIPMPGNNWLAPFQVPLRYYTNVNRRRPYVTQLLSTLTIWLLGDIGAQYITSPPRVPVSDGPSGQTDSAAQGKENKETKGGFLEGYDPKRTARALVIGGLASIPSYRWFIWLGESFNFGSKALSISFKVVFNQFTFTPVFNVYFFSMQTILTRASNDEPVSLHDITERVKNTVPASWLNSWKVWPAVVAFSFWAVPVDLRSVFAGVVAIGWQTYLGVLNQRAAKREGEGLNASIGAVEEKVGRKEVREDTAHACSKQRATA